MVKILVTGASGFIGKNICEALEGEYEIYAPAHNELNLLDQEIVLDYLKEGKFDIVIHAANTNHVKHPEVIGNVIEQDLRMYSNLTCNTKLYKRMIYFGSGAEYDLNHYVPYMKEDYLGEHIPSDQYGFAKYLAASLTNALQNIYELCLFGVFGKYEEWERRFISNVIYQCMKGAVISIDRHAFYDYLFVDDLISIIRWFIDLEHNPCYHRYNVCTGRSIDLYQIAIKIRDMIDKNIVIKLESDEWKNEYSGNNARLLEEIGGFKFEDMSDSIFKMVDYYKRHGFR